MIVIIKKDNGEKYEDYYEWIETLYDVDTTDNVEMVYHNFISDTLKELGIEILTWMFMPTTQCNSPKNWKTIKKVLKETPFEKWLLLNYFCKKLEFQEIKL